MSTSLPLSAWTMLHGACIEGIPVSTICLHLWLFYLCLYLSLASSLYHYLYLVEVAENVDVIDFGDCTVYTSDPPLVKIFPCSTACIVVICISLLTNSVKRQVLHVSGDENTHCWASLHVPERCEVDKRSSCATAGLY